MRNALLLCCLGLVFLFGCSPEPSAPVDPAPDFDLPWLNAEGELHFVTAEGKVVRGYPTGDGSVAFRIESGSDEFGFELGETHLYEWAVESGRRDDLRIEYDPFSERVDYIANGRRVSRLRSGVPRFDVAKADSRPFFHEELGLDYSSHRVYRNRLGEELVAVLERLESELEASDRFFDEDGNCSGPFRTLLAGCTAWKCGIGGGFANPLCHACVGTSIGCIVVAAQWLGGGR